MRLARASDLLRCAFSRNSSVHLGVMSSRDVRTLWLTCSLFEEESAAPNDPIFARHHAQMDILLVKSRTPKEKTRSTDGQETVSDGEGSSGRLHAARPTLVAGLSLCWIADQSVECLSAAEGLSTAGQGGALRWTARSPQQTAWSSTSFSRRTMSASSSYSFICHPGSPARAL